MQTHNMSPAHRKFDAALQQAARYRINPTYSVFRVSPCGDYTLMLTTHSRGAAYEAYRDTCLGNQYRQGIGAEVRCDGMRVDLS